MRQEIAGSIPRSFRSTTLLAQIQTSLRSLLRFVEESVYSERIGCILLESHRSADERQSVEFERGRGTNLPISNLIRIGSFESTTLPSQSKTEPIILHTLRDPLLIPNVDLISILIDIRTSRSINRRCGRRTREERFVEMTVRIVVAEIVGKGFLVEET